MIPKQLAIMLSGAGSNMEAIAQHLATLGKKAPVRIGVVISNRASAAGLAKARALGIPVVHLQDPSSAVELESVLLQYKVDLIALAGYLKLVPPQVVRAYAGRILNVHPALLPLHGGAGMYGLKVHQSVIDAKHSVSGVTVHLVDEQYDRGAILAQWVVEVLPNDVAATLAARVLAVEHTFYPKIICAFAEGVVTAQNPIAPDYNKFPQAWQLLASQ